MHVLNAAWSRDILKTLMVRYHPWYYALQVGALHATLQKPQVLYRYTKEATKVQDLCTCKPRACAVWTIQRRQIIIPCSHLAQVLI